MLTKIHIPLKASPTEAPVQEPETVPGPAPQFEPHEPDRGVPFRKPEERPDPVPPDDPNRKYRTCCLPDLDTL